ncbi:imidazolonepropionase [uncultured Roseobacter sp.]|uniref:imidazolonepropionase n=1 Tax=uncultured Roseobacter sp. TaxID=114847 RepID=UPI0026354593|nr:imidazolonepropionase [uncultured Roseobacter sp.]
MILSNLTLMAMTGAAAPLPDAAIVMQGDRIVWAGARTALPAEYHKGDHVDLGGRLVTPGLIDCHTHVVFGGNRATEFEMRLEGASYEDIARGGGGIMSTVTATRATSEEALIEQALPRVDAMIAEGVTLLEIKSGYGLDQETEPRMLRAARAIAERRPIRICTSFLGAHALPPEYAENADAYIDEICIPTLQAAHAEGLVDAVDGFCENIAFDTTQIARVFDAAHALDLPIKLHAEQLSHQGGTALAAAHGALSADHLEYATEKDAKAMAAADMVAVILPGAFYTLRERQKPPVETFRAVGVPMAISTDCNPGSSPMTSLLLAMNMACTLFRMTPAEALAGVTCHAAQALGQSNAGKIATGCRADLAIWDVTHPAELAYHIGFNPLYARVFGGRLEGPGA